MTTPSITAYPLTWPFGVNRTARPTQSRFDQKRSFERVRRELFAELNRLNAHHIVLSTNLQLRADGFPYSNRRQPEDKGVAVYFVLQDRSYCLPCDRWDRIECNCYAIAKHIQAIRGQERWGVGSVDQAFAGYQALPEPGHSSRSWPDVLRVRGQGQTAYTEEGLRNAYRTLAKILHPDNGGSDAAMAELNRAYEDARKELGYAD